MILINYKNKILLSKQNKFKFRFYNRVNLPYYPNKLKRKKG